MRIALLVALCLVLAACKKRPQPTLPLLPEGHQMAAGENVETADSTLFHTILRYPGHAEQAFAFYAPEMEKRGATRSADVYSDGNIDHQGGFGRDGAASAKDPSRPGVWLTVIELPDETRIDIWENVPKPH
jgi:hypothetical protein